VAYADLHRQSFLLAAITGSNSLPFLGHVIARLACTTSPGPVFLSCGGAMQLPMCHSRRQLEPEGPTYFCAHPRHHSTGNLVTPEMCHACPLWREAPPPTFRTVPVSIARPRGPCTHLGEQIGLRECRSCRGSVRVKVFACRHPLHGETTLSACETCCEFAPQDDAGVQPPFGESE
jgi:hypothetical protein